MFQINDRQYSDIAILLYTFSQSVVRDIIVRN